MDIAEIMHALSQTGQLPREALRAAGERRAEMVPLFIADIERFIAGDDDKALCDRLFFAFHLLGEWRERSAYRPLARLLRLPERRFRPILGDAVTETSHRVMAAVCDGDPQPLYDVILDPKADEFVRAMALQALVMAAIAGTVLRAQVADFLRDAFDRIEPRETNYVWCGWQEAVSALGLSDLVPRVREAFDRKFVDPGYGDYSYFEGDLRRALEEPDDPFGGPEGYHTLFGDTVEELSGWSCFTEKYRKERARFRSRSTDELLDELVSRLAQRQLQRMPVVNRFAKVGRNDPCPCGSGRKFKKCCLRQPIDEAA